jgi:hypothetical protein
MLLHDKAQNCEHTPAMHGSLLGVHTGLGGATVLPYRTIATDGVIVSIPSD